MIGKNPELGYTSSGDRLQETLPLTAPISDEPKSIPKSVSLSIGDLKDTQPTSNQTKDETRKDLKLPEKEAVVNSKTDSEFKKKILSLHESEKSTSDANMQLFSFTNPSRKRVFIHF